MKNRMVIGIILAVIITTGILLYPKKDEKCNYSAEKFKETYEKYNKTKEKLTIKNDNPMVEIKEENIIKKIDNGNGVMFFGSPKENESRLLVKTLLQVSKNYDCEVIYYHDLSKLDKENVSKEISKKLGDKSLKNGIVIFHKKGEISKYVEYNKESDIKKELNEGFTSISGGMCEVAKQC